MISNDAILSMMVHNAFEKSKEHTCINCGGVEKVDCKCENFENIKGRKDTSK